MSASSGPAPTLNVRPPSAVYQRPESLDEAADWLARTLSGQRIPGLILTIGFGNGHLLDVLEAQGSQARVLVLEPDPESAGRFLSRRNWDGWRDSGRLRVLVGPRFDGADDAWRMFPAIVDDCAMLVHPHLLQGAPTAEAVRVAQGIVAGARANAAARRKFAPRYLTNVLRNVPAIVDGHDVQSLRDAYRGIPAIVAAAGPSLDAALPALVEHRDRAVVFAVDTALRPCLIAGVQPQFVVGADPGAANARHFQWLPPCSDTWLIAESALDRSGTEVFDGRTLFFRVSRHHPWPWLQQWGCDAGQIDMWGSVLTAAFGVAVLAGCDPIVVVGADLAFTGGQPYARGTTYEFDWACGEAIDIPLREWWKAQTTRGQVRTETDLRGNATTTTTSMVSFRDWLAVRMPRSGRRVINATGGGILQGEGVVTGEVDSVLACLPGQVRLAPLSRLQIDPAGASRNGIERSMLRDAAGRAIVGARRDLAVDAGRAGDAGRGPATPTKTGPIPDWREFSGDGFNPEAVDAALQGAAEELARRSATRPGLWTSATTHAPVLDSTLMRALPEALRRWRALRAEASIGGGAAGTEAPAPLARSSADRRRIAGDALSLLNWIRDQAEAGGRGTDKELMAWAVDEGTSWQALPEPMRWGVALFEASLGQAAAGVPSAIQAGIPRSNDVEVAIRGRNEAVTLAIGRRVREWADCLGALEDGSSELREFIARLTLLERWLRAPRHRDGRHGTAVVAMASADRNRALSLPLDRAAIPHLFMGAVGETLRNGALSFRSGDAAVSVSLGLGGTNAGIDGSGVGVAILPQMIAQAGSPRSIVAYGSPEGAVCLRFHNRESVLVDRDGAQRPHHRWPRGITGELPLGPTGAVAWSNGRSDPHQVTPGYVMYRRHAGGDVTVEDLPFRPAGGSWCGDRVYWSCLPSGVNDWTGIASWAPGEPPRKELGGITTFDIHAAGDGELVLEPCSRRADDSIERRLATMAWHWRPGTAMRPFPLDDLGASSHRASSQGWTAVAHPHADAIRLTGPDGRTVTLLCPSPFRVAWAGSSLVVGTLTLELWRFPRVIETFECLGATLPVSIGTWPA